MCSNLSSASFIKKKECERLVEEILFGKYRHYKGKEYEVVGVARHSETLEEFVVYRALYGNHQLWIRPKSMFLETVEVNENYVPRFEHLLEK